MARQAAFAEPALGNSDRVIRSRCLVWPDDSAAWLDIHRSVFHSTSLRAVSHEQVSPPAAFLLLPRHAFVVARALDRRPGVGFLCCAPLELARTRFIRSAPRLCLRVDCDAADFFLSFGIETARLPSAGAACDRTTGRRAH